MVKRNVKRRIKKTALILIYTVFAFFAAFVILISLKTLLSKVAVGINPSAAQMLNPIGTEAQIKEIRDLLDKQNILTESLINATASGTIVAQIRDGPSVYFSTSGDPSWQVTSLSLILSRLASGDKKIALIDLRGSRPIVKFAGL